MPHDLLLRKLHFYGIRGTINNWFADYLANRRHITIVDGIKSSPADVAVSDRIFVKFLVKPDIKIFGCGSAAKY